MRALSELQIEQWIALRTPAGIGCCRFPRFGWPHYGLPCNCRIIATSRSLCARSSRTFPQNARRLGMRRVWLAGICSRQVCSLRTWEPALCRRPLRISLSPKPRIAHLKHVLRLTPSQQAHWHSLEAALRSVAHRRTADQSEPDLCSACAPGVSGYVVDATAAQRVAAAARPLIASLDQNQKSAGLAAVQAMGVSGVVLEHDPGSGHRFSEKIML